MFGKQKHYTVLNFTNTFALMYSMGVWSPQADEVWFFCAFFPVCLVNETAVLAVCNDLLSDVYASADFFFCHKRAWNSYSCVLIYCSTDHMWLMFGTGQSKFEDQREYLPIYWSSRLKTIEPVWSNNVRILWNFYADADGSNSAWLGSHLLHFETSLPWSAKPVTGYCSSQILVSIYQTKIRFMYTHGIFHSDLITYYTPDRVWLLDLCSPLLPAFTDRGSLSFPVHFWLSRNTIEI